uniref:Uncharacterized protein n=1 Tax=Oncorhynchus tshawytscha TaxID=74940 RepID=A0A8C8JP01_ONCTS
MPINVKFNSRSTPYSATRKRDINNGVSLGYVKPVKYSGIVRKGQRLGTMMPMSNHTKYIDR